MVPTRAWVAVSLFTMVFLASVPSASAVEPCAQTLDSVPVGTGQTLIDNALLADVNHVDVPIPSCSQGRFSYGTGTSATIGVQKFCVDGFIRVYASAGTFDNKFVINWLSNDGQGCAATVPEPPTLPPLPLP